MTNTAPDRRAQQIAAVRAVGPSTSAPNTPSNSSERH
jgi:hypothetical protein